MEPLLKRMPYKYESRKFKTVSKNQADTAYINLSYKNNINVFLKNSNPDFQDQRKKEKKTVSEITSIIGYRESSIIKNIRTKHRNK